MFAILFKRIEFIISSTIPIEIHQTSNGGFSSHMSAITFWQGILNANRNGIVLIWATSMMILTSDFKTSEKLWILLTIVWNWTLNRNYPSLWVIFAMSLPIFVPIYFWNESLWIATWMNLFRSYFNVTHIGYSNSFNHVFGTRPFDGTISATDNFYVNLYLFGEGNHNFHHTFPQDYKSAEFASLKNFNILTAFIDIFEKLGLAYDLKTTPPEIIAKRLQRTGDGTHVKSFADD